MPVAGNGQPGFAAYRRDRDGYALHTLQIVTVTASGISRNSVFQEPEIFASFKLPSRLAPRGVRSSRGIRLDVSNAWSAGAVSDMVRRGNDATGWLPHGHPKGWATVMRSRPRCTAQKGGGPTMVMLPVEAAACRIRSKSTGRAGSPGIAGSLAVR